MDWYWIFPGLVFLAAATAPLLMRIKYGRPTLRWVRISTWSFMALDTAIGLWFIYLGITA